MPSTYEIDIVGGYEGHPIFFDPNPRECNAGDSVFWRNHTPAEQLILQFINGKAVEPPMTMPIPSMGVSSIFSPGPNTGAPNDSYKIEYGLKSDAAPTGVIVVNPQA
jgi:hypothetical protein